jgi:hypothetical protein
MIQALGTLTIRHYGFVMYGFRSKLMGLSQPVQVTDNNNATLAYYVTCPFTDHYKSVKFYCTDPWGPLL